MTMTMDAPTTESWEELVEIAGNRRDSWRKKTKQLKEAAMNCNKGTPTTHNHLHVKIRDHNHNKGGYSVHSSVPQMRSAQEMLLL